MKKTFIYSLILSTVLSLSTSCSDDDSVDKNTNTGGNDTELSFKDTLTIPSDAAYLGDSIQRMTKFALNKHSVGKVTVSTTENGHIAVLGGYKDYSAVYIYAKTDDNKMNLTNEKIKVLFEKYYLVNSQIDGSEINVVVKENPNVIHESDFQKLRVSIEVFTPCQVSTKLNISKGSIFVSNLDGNLHESSSVTGSIKYLNSRGERIVTGSQNGSINLINTVATESINANLNKGSIQIAVPIKTKTTLKLQSATSVNAYVLNNSNFAGTKTKTIVDGKLNGGGYTINAVATIGNITFRWYDKDNEE